MGAHDLDQAADLLVPADEGGQPGPKAG